MNLKRKALIVLFLFLIMVSIVNSMTRISDTQILTPTIEIKDLIFPRFAIFTFEGDSNHNIPIAFNESFIIQTNNISNKYAMEICFWETELEKMSLCINEGAANRATTFYRSLQIVGEDKLPNNENFTLCEGYNYIDCNTSTTGADLGVEDDIEAKGNIYSSEVITSKIKTDLLKVDNITADIVKADIVIPDNGYTGNCINTTYLNGIATGCND